MNRSSWKPKYVNSFLLNSILKNKGRSIINTKSRASVILQSFVGLVFGVYTGRRYTIFYVEKSMVGHRLGEFSFTRKMGNIHIKKLKKNLKKDKLKSNKK